MFCRVIADIERTLMKGKMLPKVNKGSFIYPTALHIYNIIVLNMYLYVLKIIIYHKQNIYVF